METLNHRAPSTALTAAFQAAFIALQLCTVIRWPELMTLSPNWISLPFIITAITAAVLRNS